MARKAAEILPWGPRRGPPEAVQPDVVALSAGKHLYLFDLSRYR